MSKLVIYHNPRCSKSRATLELVEKSGDAFEIVDYLKNPPSPQELKKLLSMLGMPPEKIARTHEDVFTELKLDKNPPKNEAQWIEVLVKNPILIERPIVTDGKRAVIGRPPEKVLKLLGK